MPNWCSNIVEFKGDEKQIESLKELFEQMAQKEKETEQGQLPDFIAKEKGGYFFEIAWDNDYLSYQTKWSPNIAIVTELADNYQVGFVQSYSEPGMCIFGETNYDGKTLTDVSLTDEDYEQITFDEENETYLFEGDTYESDYEIWETLLERKKDGPEKNQFIRR
jgi:hypothetical protein